MIAGGERYIVDEGGTKLSVVLDVEYYERLVAQAVELESIRAHDAPGTSGQEKTCEEQTVREGRVRYGQRVSPAYRVSLQATEEGYAVWCPGLPGCWSQGATEEEALENIKDAIATYLAAVDELAEGQLTRFTMGGIIKDAGLTIEQFKKLL